MQKIIGSFYVVLKINFARETVLATIAERAFMKTLEGGCSVPVAVNSKVSKLYIYICLVVHRHKKYNIYRNVTDLIHQQNRSIVSIEYFTSFQEVNNLSVSLKDS